MTRTTELQHFLDVTLDAFDHRAGQPEARRTIDGVRAALASHGPAAAVPGDRPPVRQHLGDALHFRTLVRSLAELPRRFMRIERMLDWRTPSNEAAGHASACIVGPEGLERRSDVILGATLMAPFVERVADSGEGEHVYLFLSSGEWRAAGESWDLPGIGRTRFCPAQNSIAMRSRDTAFFAMWMSWIGSS